MKLRNKKTIITSDYEQTPKKEILPVIGKITYYLILFIIIFFIARFLINSVIYSTGKGQVISESFLISPGEYSQIKEIFIKKGDQVKKGSPLVSLIKFQNNNDFYERELIRLENRLLEEKRKLKELNKNEIFLKNAKTPFTLKKIELQNDINNLEAEIEEFEKNADFKENSVEISRSLRILEAVESENIASEEAEKLNNRISYMKDKLNNLQSLYKKIIVREKEYINNLKHEKKIETNSLQSSILNIYKNIEQIKNIKSQSYKYNTLYSPVKGSVKNVLRLKGENLEKDDSIIEIKEKNPKILIRAYFPLKIKDKLSVNKDLTVIFPDGKKSKGIIDNLYSLSDRKTVDRLEGYKPVETHIAADIKPVSPKDETMWENYNNLDVELRFLK